jgi:hypothetical protein
MSDAEILLSLLGTLHNLWWNGVIDNAKYHAAASRCLSPHPLRPSLCEVAIALAADLQPHSPPAPDDAAPRSGTGEGGDNLPR